MIPRRKITFSLRSSSQVNLIWFIYFTACYIDHAHSGKLKLFVSFSYIEVQYKVVESKVPSAYYKLTDASAQIRSYVFDSIRSSVPRMELDNTFASKDEIANQVKQNLTVTMSDYGYEIIAALVMDVIPDIHVKKAMNEINGT